VSVLQGPHESGLTRFLPEYAGKIVENDQSLFHMVPMNLAYETVFYLNTMVRVENGQGLYHRVSMNLA